MFAAAMGSWMPDKNHTQSRPPCTLVRDADTGSSKRARKEKYALTALGQNIGGGGRGAREGAGGGVGDAETCGARAEWSIEKSV